VNTPIDKSAVPDTGAVCNYLGLQDDPGTSLAVPSLLNMCYRARPVEPVRLEHQRLFCQTANHAQCPVFRAEQGMRLPVEIRGHRLRSATRRSAPALWLLPIGVLLVAAIVLVVGLRWPHSLPSLRGLAEITSTLGPASSVFPTPASATAVQPLPPIILGASSTDMGPLPTSTSPTPIPTSSASPSSPFKPTRTPSPTLTLSATATSTPLGQCGHQLEETFGSSHRLLIHRVKGGESLNMFADRYYTSVDVIEGLNFELYVPIRNESAIVIAPGLRQTSVLPAFDAMEVQEPGSTLSSLAAKASVPLEVLAQYNNFGSDCRTIVGWLVIPHEPTPIP
jgi:hypothetical protein